MNIRFDESKHTESPETPSLLVSLGNAVDLTLGDGGKGGEDKRYEYN